MIAAEDGSQDGLPELFTDEEWKALAGRFGLTTRQREIARLLCQGESRLKIAKTLRIAPDTAHTHTKEVFRKAGVKNRVSFAVRLVVAARTLDRTTRA